MEYSHSDEELLTQPIGYWSTTAGNAVVTAIREGLAPFGVTQPQWWILGQLATGENGRSRDEVLSVLWGYLDVGEALVPEMDALLDRGLITPDAEGRLHLTAEGDELFQKCASFQRSMRERVHKDITNEEYVVTLKVLQRMIHNVGAKAWHH
ncbi:MarR family winged helix-turn-helix transcriptional regulator [Streptomyces liangshanensis]|uniref:Winged helix-turn-helix transcriptional regulator n=1 Tax=Streptomyces liangshanensis TaxID=2717324 RepID=A0A6G9H2J6_9ACTN|nr:MarR family winged helix-turn-helix transcriptional regulator [Streptomyces liangshanensis]QIQ04725.1 winged helix-turn-helix transcriptional regulator [Streptomyces liangshanensis]